MKDKIKQWVYHGTLATSPFNIQAWKFIFKSDCLEVYLDETNLEKNCITDSDNKEQYIALGSAIENIVISAHHDGYKTAVRYFPEGEDHPLAAVIEFKAGEYQVSEEEKLIYQHIEKRWTNRNKMKRRQVPEDILMDLQTPLKGEKNFQLVITTREEKLKRIARLCFDSETIKWEIPSSQQKSYNWLRFSFNLNGVRDGVPIWYMGVLKPAAPLLKLLLKWKMVRFLNLFGLSKIVGYRSRWVKARRASNQMVLLSRINDKTHWVKGGQIYERMLLIAMKHNLAIQPFNCIEEWIDVYLLGIADRLSKKHKKKVGEIYLETIKNFELSPEPCILMVYAAGYAPGKMPPYMRKPVENVLQIQE